MSAAARPAGKGYELYRDIGLEVRTQVTCKGPTGAYIHSTARFPADWSGTDVR